MDSTPALFDSFYELLPVDGGRDRGELLQLEEFPSLLEFLGLPVGEEFEELFPVLGENMLPGVE